MSADTAPGTFEYPPPTGSPREDYEREDSVIAQWSTSLENTTACQLDLYYWPLGGSSVWTSSGTLEVPCNGSQQFPLSFYSKQYLGQFNLNYTTQYGDAVQIKSNIFNVHNQTRSAQVWSISSLSSSISSSASATSTASPTSATPSSSTASPPTDSPAVTGTDAGTQLNAAASSPITNPSSASSVNGGEIAGIVIGSVALLCMIIGMLVLFYCRGRRLRIQRRSQHAMTVNRPIEAGMWMTADAANAYSATAAGAIPIPNRGGRHPAYRGGGATMPYETTVIPKDPQMIMTPDKAHFPGWYAPWKARGFFGRAKFMAQLPDDGGSRGSVMAWELPANKEME